MGAGEVVEGRGKVAELSKKAEIIEAQKEVKGGGRAARGRTTQTSDDAVERERDEGEGRSMRSVNKNGPKSRRK